MHVSLLWVVLVALPLHHMLHVRWDANAGRFGTSLALRCAQPPWRVRPDGIIPLPFATFRLGSD
jgi:hypothetical protein